MVIRGSSNVNGGLGQLKRESWFGAAHTTRMVVRGSSNVNGGSEKHMQVRNNIIPA